MHNLRSFVFWLLICAMIAVFSFGAAFGFTERDRYYLYITTSDTPMYSADSSMDSSDLTQIGVLPSGTPVSSGDEIGAAYRRITYMDENGSTHSVVIDKSVIKSNYATLDFNESIGKIAVPIPAISNSEWVSDYLSYRGKNVSMMEIENALAVYSGTVTPAPAEEDQAIEENNDNDPELINQEEPDSSEAENLQTESTDAESSETLTDETATVSGEEGTDVSQNKPKKQIITSTTAVPDSNIYYQSDEGKLLLVAVKQLGLSRSIITVNENEFEVETSMLVWNTTADADHRIAVVHAPKSGKASLRKTEKSSSKVIKSLASGTVVAVFDMQDSVTGIYYDGLIGYMKNSSLLYFPSERDYQTAVLTYNGSTTNTHRINMYNLPKESSKRLLGLRAGTPVTVYSEENEFYEVEVSGRHGYIYTKFVTIDENQSELQALPEGLFLEELVAEPDPDVNEDDNGFVSEEQPQNTDTDNSADLSSDYVSEETDDTSSDSSTSTGYEPFIVNGYDMHRNPYN